MITSGTAAKVQEYIEGVMSGDIIVGAHVRAAVERHVDDLAKQSTPDFPYHFDAATAGVAVDFFPLMLRHSSGKFAGMPFELEPWQAFGVWCMFGWKRNSDNARRFRKFLWSMGRKNGKSCLAAGIAIYLAMLDINPFTRQPESVAEVVLAATKKEQVEKVIYAEIERMRKRSPHIEKLSSPINKQITFKHNGGSIRCIGSDKPYDGLNPHSVILDEIHAWREFHRPFYSTMQTGSGSRVQPLIGAVTTAGDDKSHIWLDEWKYCDAILSRTIKDESYFAYIFQLDNSDDPFDESVWVKANPNLGVSLGVDYLRDRAKEAKFNNLKKHDLLRYHCNIQVTSTESAFDLDKWDASTGELSDWSKADAIAAGFDLGSRDDLAAWMLCARFPIDSDSEKPMYRYEFKGRAYIAEDSKRDLQKQPFAEWIYQDLLYKCKHPITNMKHDLIEACTIHGVKQVGYDPFTAQQFAEDMNQEGLEPIRIAQNCAQFTEPIEDFILALCENRVRIENNPLLRWCAKNAMLYRDRNARCMFDKKTSVDKIDPIVAMVMAFRLCSLAPQRASGPLFVI